MNIFYLHLKKRTVLRTRNKKITTSNTKQDNWNYLMQLINLGQTRIKKFRIRIRVMQIIPNPDKSYANHS